jgi:hypothetical protein
MDIDALTQQFLAIEPRVATWGLLGYRKASLATDLGQSTAKSFVLTTFCGLGRESTP